MYVCVNGWKDGSVHMGVVRLDDESPKIPWPTIHTIPHPTPLRRCAIAPQFIETDAADRDEDALVEVRSQRRVGV